MCTSTWTIDWVGNQVMVLVGWSPSGAVVNMHNVTSWCLSWYDHRRCQDVKHQQTTQSWSLLRAHFEAGNFSSSKRVNGYLLLNFIRTCYLLPDTLGTSGITARRVRLKVNAWVTGRVCVLTNCQAYISHWWQLHSVAPLLYGSLGPWPDIPLSHVSWCQLYSVAP